KIEVHGCAPGSYMVVNDDGTWDCMANPDPWWGSGGGPSIPAPGGGGEPEPGPGSGGPPEKPVPQTKPPKQPIRKPYHPKVGDPCHAEFIRVQDGNALDWTTQVRTGIYIKNIDPAHKGEYQCDDNKNIKIESCLNGKPIKSSNKDGDYYDWYLCFDGHR